MRCACVAALLLASTAHAFVGNDDHLIVASGSAPRVARAVDVERRGTWTVQRDRDTRAVTSMTGGFVDVPGAIADAQVAERAARAFLVAHVLPAGTRIEDFTLVANRVDDGKRTVAFAQTYRGLRVVGGQMHVVFAHDRLFAAGSQAWPNVIATIPRARAATNRAAAWIGAPVRVTGERVILPLVREGKVEYRVADVMEAEQLDIYVAPDGAPIAKQRRGAHATSTLQLDVGVRYAKGARAAVPAGQLNITVDGTAVTTAADGTFGWTGAGSVVTSVVGPRIMVIDEAGAAATTTLIAQDGMPMTWSAATNELVDAQLSAFSYVTVAKAIARRINPGLAWLDQQIEVHVNGENEDCNAFSSGDSIHFYKASAVCENTARVADVVQHEFGHSFHQQSIIAGVGAFDGSMTEGIADFFAANISNDSGIGRGVFLDDSPVRELDPIGSERVYPRDFGGGVHNSGLIIGGALWDLREQLIGKLGAVAGVAATEKVYLGILQRAADLTMTYQAALVADDDDGNLGNGTPNGCAIESAFGRHGLAGADFRETRLVTPVIEGRRVTVAVDTPAATMCPPATVTAMKLAWRVGTGALSEVAMTNSGATWSADLPAQPDGTVIEYQIAAALDTSETLLLPDNAADPLYQTFVGAATEIYCEHFATDPHWKQGGTVANEWDVAVSNATNNAGDPATAFAGTLWLGTDLRADGRYRADILSTIETPPIDATRFEHVHLQFRRWLVIEDSALDVATVRVNGQQIWANATNDTDSLDHIDREWRFVDFDISQYARDPVTITWTLASDPLRQLGGWNLDEICVVGIDRRPTCGDDVVDPDEECEPGIDEHCTETCERRNDDGGCCSGSASLPTLLFGLLQFVMILLRRR